MESGEGEDFGAREFHGERILETLQAIGAHQVGLVDHDHVRFLELFPINVNHLGSEYAARFKAQDAQTAHRVDQHAEGRDREAVSIETAQGIGDRRPEVGTASDGLGKEDLRSGVACEVRGGIHQGLESATETAAGNFLDRQLAGSSQGGVDQTAALIVGDESYAHTVFDELLSQTYHRGGFAGAQKPADHDVTRVKHRKFPRSGETLAFYRW